MDKYNLQLRALRTKKDLTLTELAEKNRLKLSNCRTLGTRNNRDYSE